MTVYAPSDVRAITVPIQFGGCGEPHVSAELAEGERWALDCESCGQALTRPPLSSHGWAHSIDKVALTPDERRLLETQEKEGSAATALMVRQLGDTLAAAVRQGYLGHAAPAPAPPSTSELMSALKSLAPEDLAQLLTIAGLDNTAPAGGPTVTLAGAPAKKVAAPRKAAQ